MLAFTVSVQLGSVPLHAPDHPEKVLPTDGLAFNVRLAPPVTESTHVDGQFSAPSLETTDPCPVPVTATLTCSLGVKFTLTFCEVVMSRSQTLSVPVQAPPHPEKEVLLAPVAVRKADEPGSMGWVQVEVHVTLEPSFDSTTDPAPLNVRDI